VRALCERIRQTVPRIAPLVIAGDFNDWRPPREPAAVDQLGVSEVFEAVKWPRRAHVPVGDADVPARPHLLRAAST
jgi:endonuclease/exonuclease/phosphatase family metal-dependent hydrolase